jgi:hypothetical protein
MPKETELDSMIATRHRFAIELGAAFLRFEEATVPIPNEFTQEHGRGQVGRRFRALQRVSRLGRALPVAVPQQSVDLAATPGQIYTRSEHLERSVKSRHAGL